MRATPGNYTHRPMPEERAQLDFERTLSDAEYHALIQGVIPKSQEDRWFAFEVDDWFTLCRSGTGNCIFRLKLEHADGGWRVAEAWANRATDQYDSEDDEADAMMLHRLVDGIIARNMQ
jgi:hypothetical protein